MSSRVAQSCQGHRDITRLPKGCLLCPPPPCPLHSCCPGCFPDLFSGLWNSILCLLPWRHRGHQSSLEKKDVSEPDSGHTASVPRTELLHRPVNSRYSVHAVCHPSCSQMTLHLLEIFPSSRTSWPWSCPPMSPPPLLNPGAAGKAGASATSTLEPTRVSWGHGASQGGLFFRGSPLVESPSNEGTVLYW